jgi:hypothetical protein
MAIRTVKEADVLPLNYSRSLKSMTYAVESSFLSILPDWMGKRPLEARFPIRAPTPIQGMDSRTGENAILKKYIKLR